MSRFFGYLIGCGAIIVLSYSIKKIHDKEKLHREIMKHLIDKYAERSDTTIHVRAVPQNSLKPNSHDLSRLGLAEGFSWKQARDEFDQVVKKNRSAKTVFLVRHGEGDHNAAERRLGSEHWEAVEAKSYKYFDAHLNDVGITQSEALHRAFLRAAAEGLRIDVIIVSPLTRAIETAKYGLASIWNKVPIYAVEMSRERFGKNMCDKRKTLTELKKNFPEVNFDYFMESEEDHWFTPERETDDQINKRISLFYNWLMESPESWRNVAIVGHSSFMCQSIQCLGAPRHWPSNCEMVPVVIEKKM